jgi:thioredoxin:protein disulfide reductase
MEELSVLALVGIFISGLALNLTPCVYPMLSVTVALFRSGKGSRVSESFPKALLYFLGISSMYSLLGVVAAFSGGFFGAAFQHSWVLISISILMFILGLSMLGLYEFQVPPALLNWMGGKKRTGYVGMFLSGLMVGVFAAPCIGPPIVALLALVGQSGSPAQGFLIFFVLSLGLGLPYLLLGTFSGLMQQLPRSGDWLVWVKKLFGCALFGLALFYFGLGLYPDLIPYVFPLTLLGAGTYLGFIEPSGDKILIFRRGKRFVGAVAIFAVTAHFLWQPKVAVVWADYSAERLEAALQVKKPVVIDVYADWCIPCHELEKFTYTDTKVIEALEPFERLKVDATNPTTPKALEPLERFEVPGVPAILFLTSDGQEVRGARIVGYVPPEIFLESVEMLVEREAKVV